MFNPGLFGNYSVVFLINGVVVGVFVFVAMKPVK